MKATKAPRRRQLAATLLATLAAFSLGGCANPVQAVMVTVSAPSVDEALDQRSATAQAQVSTSALVEGGTLTVGLDTAASAPMCITSQSGAFQGYDVDFASALAEQLGLKVKFVSVSNASQSLGSSCDVVMGADSASSKNATVVGSYAEGATAFFKKGSATTVSKADIDGTAVGVQDGSSSQQLLKRSNIQATQKGFANLNAAFDALDAGEVDYVLCDANSGAYLAASYGDISPVGTIDVPTSMGLAVATANTELQDVVKQAVDKLASNGVVDIIRSKWLGGMDALTDSSQVSGVVISAAVTEPTTAESATVDGATSGIQDGSTAGANAVDISE